MTDWLKRVAAPSNVLTLAFPWIFKWVDYMQKQCNEWLQCKWIQSELWKILHRCPSLNFQFGWCDDNGDDDNDNAGDTDKDNENYDHDEEDDENEEWDDDDDQDAGDLVLLGYFQSCLTTTRMWKSRAMYWSWSEKMWRSMRRPLIKMSHVTLLTR